MLGCSHDIEPRGAAIYDAGAWFDIDTYGRASLHASLRNPKKLSMLPWFHREFDERDRIRAMFDDRDLGAYPRGR